MNKRYFADLAERAGKTFLQAYLAAWVGASALSGDVPEFDRLFTLANLKLAIAATVFSVLTSLASKPVNNPNSASILQPELQPPAPIPDDPGGPKVIQEPLQVNIAGRVTPLSDDEMHRRIAEARKDPPPPPPPPPPGVSSTVVVRDVAAPDPPFEPFRPPPPVDLSR